MRWIIGLGVLLGASPSLAGDLTIVLNDQQQQILIQALDAYVRTKGLSGAGNAVSILQAMQASANANPSARPSPGESAAPKEQGK